MSCQHKWLEESAWTVPTTALTALFCGPPIYTVVSFGLHGEAKWNQPPAVVFQAEGLCGEVFAIKSRTRAVCLQGLLFIRLNRQPYAALHCRLLELSSHLSDTNQNSNVPYICSAIFKEWIHTTSPTQKQGTCSFEELIKISLETKDRAADSVFENNVLNYSG